MLATDLSFDCRRKAMGEKGDLGCGLKPDSGKPTVRDYRGALGNVI
jgi:hypothetical protein